MKVVLYGSPVTPFCDDLTNRLGKGWTISCVDDATPADDVEALFADADAVVAVNYGANAPASEKLRLIQVPGAGCDGIDITALPPGSTLCNVYEHDNAVAEYVLLALLQWCLRFAEADLAFRNGSWARSSRFGGRPSNELAGKTVGIVGLGRIGKAVLSRVKPFGTRVVAARHHDTTPVEGCDRIYHFNELAKMSEECDFLVLCSALTAETKGMVDRLVLKAMASHAVIINVGRGQLIEEKALYDALSEKTIGGAVIDVWYQYPDAVNADTLPSRYDFSTLSNLYMTPHIAGWTDGTIERRFEFIATNLNRVRDGQPPLNVVHRA